MFRKLTVLVVAFAVLGPACATQLSVPDGTDINCDSEQDCPGNLVCAVAVHRCVEPAAAAEAPPAILSHTLSDDLGTYDSLFELSIVVSKPLAKDPIVLLDAGPRSAPWQLVEMETNRETSIYAFHYTADGSESAGVRAITASLVDTVGNRSDGIAVDAIELDFSPPNLRSSDLSRAAANDFAVVELGLSFSESVAEAPSVTMQRVAGTETLTWTRLDSGVTADPTYSFSPTGEEVEGEYDIVAVASDLAGNVTAPLDLGTLRLDFTAPVLTGIETDPPRVRSGQVVRARFTVDDIPAGTPGVVLRPTTGPDIPFESPQVVGTVATFLHEVQPAEAGDYEVHLSGLEDEAGNLLGPTLLGSVTVDNTPPSLLNFTSNGTSFVAADTLLVTFDTSEPLSGAPVVRLADFLLTPTTSPDSNPHAFQIALNTTSLSGTQPVFVVLTDTVGNQSRPNPISITLDTLAPTLLDIVFSPGRARDAQRALLTVTCDELLTDHPVLQWNATAGDPGFQPLSRSGLNYTYEIVSTTGTAADSYQLDSISLEDAAGNAVTVGAAEAATLLPHAFVVDKTLPFLTSGPTLNKDPAAYRAGETIIVDFTTNEELFGLPNAQLGLIPPLPLPCATVGANAYSCSAPGPLAGNEAQGPTGLSLEIADRARNQALLTTTVTLDFAPPEVISAEPERAGYRDGETIVYTVTLSEALAQPGLPTLSVYRDGQAVAGFFGAPLSATDTRFIYEHLIVPGDDGEYTIEINAEDNAGNTRAAEPGTGFEIDTAVPGISGTIVLNSSNGFYRAGDSVIVEFSIDENISPALPIVSLHTTTAVGLPCVEGPAQSYTCSQPSPLVSTQTPVEVPVGVLVELVDAVGNRSFASTTVTLDFTAPLLVDDRVTLSLAPDADYPFSTAMLNEAPRVARPGTALTLSFATTEPLGPAPTLTTTPVDLGFAAGPSSATSFTYNQVIPATPTNGSYRIAVSLTDRAGNSSSYSNVNGGDFELDSIAPNMPDTSAGGPITYTRHPWGSDTSGGSKAFTVEGASGAIQASAWVFVYDNSNTEEGSELARREATSNGAFGGASDPQGTLTLPNTDRPEVFVVAVDRAGNMSDALPGTAIIDAVRANNVVWVATLGGKIAGGLFANPHRLEARTAFSDLRDDQNALEFSDDTARGLALIDGVPHATTSTGGSWQQRYAPGGDLAPSRRAIFDSHRNEVIAFGGGNWPDVSDETWRWDGAHWRLVVPTDPQGDGNPGGAYVQAFAFDPLRGRGVMFGGSSAGSLAGTDLTWEWDGESWEKVCDPSQGCAAPSARADIDMVEFPPHGTVVLFGGSGIAPEDGEELWQWDGAGWSEVPKAGLWPEARSRHAMAYDTQREVVVLIGGEGCGGVCDDLWEWDGTDWSNPRPVGSGGGSNPPGYSRAVATYDPRREVTVLVKDTALWQWNGAAWNQPTLTDPEQDGAPSAPPPLRMHMLLYDGARGKVMLSGGNEATYNNVWLLDGVSWALVAQDPLDPGAPQPQSTFGMSMAYDSNRGRIIKVGGYARRPIGYSIAPSETWEWNGASWSKLCSSCALTNRARPALAFDAARDQLVLHGGDSAAPTDTWVFKGGVWDRRCDGAPAGDVCGTLPPGGAGHSMALDSNGDMMIFVAGQTWTWDDAVWSRRCDGTPVADTCTAEPPGRSNYAMAFDPMAQLTYLFGGTGRADSWSWDGADWQSVCDPAGGCAAPSPRVGALLSYDPSRDRMILLGGAVATGVCDPSTDQRCIDVWELEADTWSEIDVIDPESDGNPDYREFTAYAFDAGRQEALQFGGAFISVDNAVTERDDVWTWRGGSDRRSAHVARFNFALSGVPESADATDLSLRWVAGADAVDASGDISGAQLLVWDAGWRDAIATSNLPSHGAQTSSPAELSWQVTDPGIIERIQQEPLRTFRFAVAPRGTLSDGDGATISTDYVELTVRYQLP